MLEMSEKEILMSFCIPVFNSEKTILVTVNSILKCERNDIEVVLFYDKSQDDTLNIINSIKDKRVRIVINENRLPYGKMLIECGKQARGKYLMYVIDRNYLSAYKTDELLDFISRNEDITCGMSCPIRIDYKKGKCNPVKDNTYNLYEDVFSKMAVFAYQEQHITCNLFKKDLFVDAAENIKNEKFGNFPLDYIYAEICSRPGKALEYSFIYQYESDYLCMKTGTKSTKPIRKEWYSPSGRIRYYTNTMVHLYKLDMDKEDRKKIKKRMFYKTIFQATVGYEDMMKNVKICRHYLRDAEYVGVLASMLHRLQCYCSYLAIPFIVRSANGKGK
jgi:glycosyltransferase involved in cell wall biosynthesis